ncbi:hypothetical protein AB1Y20_013850 [Prymnesium parvum]|uniref:Sialate O-acetylesterase domain-containing protein n=1 Tax=Prymnesium parvum TaxID=97485 RepID=A0AB34IEE7_PRYPA
MATFAAVFSDHAVLQQAPSRAAVYGTVPRAFPPPRLVLRAPTAEVHLTSTLTPCAATSRRCGWLAYLPPTPSSAPPHNLSLPSRTLTDLVFGDVWLCAGQSNMALPLSHTFGGAAATAAAARGAYPSVRLLCATSAFPPAPSPPSSPSPPAAWATAAACARRGALAAFCAVCFHFAAALSAAPRRRAAVGLACAAADGTPLESWSPPAAAAEPREPRCAAPLGGGGARGEAYAARLAPLERMSIKGWLFYQGESNTRTNGVSGNEAAALGYGCGLPRLVRRWRRRWAAAENTTAADAPFGVVALHPQAAYPGGSRDFGGMRWSQTANRGVLPNEAMPNTFLAQALLAPAAPHFADASWACAAPSRRRLLPSRAVSISFQPLPSSASGPSTSSIPTSVLTAGPHTSPTTSRPPTPPYSFPPLHSLRLHTNPHHLATTTASLHSTTYDLHDPWNVDASCYAWGCCSHNGEQVVSLHSPAECARRTRPWGGSAACEPYCAALRRTPALMPGFAGLHPRLKRPVGERLAAAALRQVYGHTEGAFTGPTLAGCTRRRDRLVLRFNASLLRGERVRVLNYTRASSAGWSGLEGLAARHNASFCVQPMQRCPASAAQCHRTRRTWFCPRHMGPDYDVPALAAEGLADFTPITGFFNLAAMPVDDAFEPFWVPLHIRARGRDEVVVDLSPLQGDAPYAIRYAWSDRLLCDTDAARLNRKPCPAEQAPIQGSGGLPANPFLARFRGDRCECLPPQQCNG